MSDTESRKTSAKARPAASNTSSEAAASKPPTAPRGPKAASKARAAAPKAATPAAETKRPTLPGEQPDEAPIPPRNRHERRSAGKKRPGQAPFKWPPIGPERP